MTGPSLSHILDSPRPVSQPRDAQGSLEYSNFASSPVGANSSRAPSPYPPTLGHMGSPAAAPPLSSAPPSTPAGRSHAGSNLYACRDCGRSYSRPEHLVRHVQTHTLGRRFTCDICSKSFARKDLLRRHVANHGNSSSYKRPRMASSPAAGRVMQACRPCAAARVKCDETKPCRRCLDRNIACLVPDSSAATAVHLTHPPPVAKSNPTPGSEGCSTPTAHDATPAASMPAPDPPSSSSNTPRSQHTPSRPDDGQLPTPDTATDNVFSQPLGRPSALSNVVMGINLNHSPFSDFLRDILYQQPFDPARCSDTQSLAPLDFCDNSNLELTDVDFGLLDYWNLDCMTQGTLPIPESGHHTSEDAAGISQMRPSLVQAWAVSPWRWDPKSNDTGYKEQGFLPLSAKDTSSAQFLESRNRLQRVVSEKLEQPSRDRVLAIVLSTCGKNLTANRVASSFPTVEVLDVLVHTFLAAQACQVDEWIHFPTLKLNEQWPEWIAMAAAMGGALTPMPTLRKFGFAVQEAVRVTIPSRFEENNTAIQRLGLVQSLILVQDLGLWSGNRRKMEIAECHLVIPVTMMRYRGQFQRSKYPALTVDAADQDDVLEKKWKYWIEREQWKRLVFHCYIREAQTSMTTLTNPCISYSELTLPLPEARELWLAKDAAEWKERYLERNRGQMQRPPSVGDILRDVHLLGKNYMRLDIQYSMSIFLHGFWTLILEYRQLSSVQRTRSYMDSAGNSHADLLKTRHDELVKDLDQFELAIGRWQDMSAREHLVLNLLMLNLHVSLDDLQLFSGKEGEDQARRIYPVLQRWAATPESRAAVWRGAQVLRYAKLFPTDHLNGFYAVAVHHAALALWTYGVVLRAHGRRAGPGAGQFVVSEAVHLDQGDSAAIQGFLDGDQGRPMIKGPTTGQASLYDPRACMSIAQEILRSNFGRGQELPPLVENVCHIVQQLGDAAWAVGLG
ncbi:hypothetical protein CDD82_130 [Ophiocordyceps australis]|uniref:pH-response transcription factor pacC/RIM101 n=1 Tax=Ophiocordyceps australis TaxID=1399860 RepID=A0A2C5XSX3_9HYPO|nr:hypothetical protein CDD82_130 [Ophiocordyceps australis]